MRRSRYDGQDGFLLCGRPLGNAFPCRVFTRSKAVAKAYRRLLTDPRIAMDAPGPSTSARFWQRVRDGLLIAERTR